MNRARLPLIAWLAGCSVLLGVAGVVTVHLWQQDNDMRSVLIERERDSRVRLALWRIDARLMSMLTLENANWWTSEVEDQENSLPSTARLTCNVAVPGNPVAESIAHAMDRAVIEESEDQGLLASTLPNQSVWQAQQQVADFDVNSNDLSQRAAYNQQAFENVRKVKQTQSWKQAQVIEQQQAILNVDPADRRLEALWVDNELVMYRPVVGKRDEAYVIQLDLQELRQRLNADIQDLLPEARFERPSDQTHDQRLAALPLALVPGEALPGFTVPPTHRIRVVVTGAALVVAVLAMMGLAFGTLALARRRSAFVAAVTHELRTPLTTLRMYGELLEQDMVPEDERPEYIAMLRQEADRLAVMVDNVLAFARLEGRERVVSPINVVDIVTDLRPRLEARLKPVGLTLDWQMPDDVEMIVQAERSAIEHIVSNLIDNAAKYAADGETVVVTCVERDGRVALSVRDYGPGLPADAQRWLFKPFARHEHSTQPGVGLGLALCRQLARHMGADLTTASVSPGACFVLRFTSAR